MIYLNILHITQFYLILTMNACLYVDKGTLRLIEGLSRHMYACVCTCVCASNTSVCTMIVLLLNQLVKTMMHCYTKFT